MRYQNVQLDINALTQHGALFGVDCDPIRAAHAYRDQLEILFAEGYDASSSHASCSSQQLISSSHLQAKEAIMPIHAYAASTNAVPLICGATQPLLRRADSCIPRSRSPMRRTSRANAATILPNSCEAKSAAFSKTAPTSQQLITCSTSSSTTASGLGPHRAHFVFEGSNPNGSDTVVGSLVKPTALR